MEKEIEYRGEVTCPPQKYEAGRFKIHLMQNSTEIGLVSGYFYSPDSFGTYGGILTYTDELDSDEFALMEIIAGIIDEILKRRMPWSYKTPVENELMTLAIATLDRVYIRPEYRGHGYATEAMTHVMKVIEELFDEECEIIGLIAHAFEPDPAESFEELLDFVKYSDDESITNKLVKMYEKAGFLQVAELQEQANAKVMLMIKQS